MVYSIFLNVLFSFYRSARVFGYNVVTCSSHLQISGCEVFESEGLEDDQNEEGYSSLEDEVQARKGQQASRSGFKPSDRSQEFNQQVTRFAIIAQATNGEIQQVAYDDQEQTWVLNFKKGILDAIHLRADAETQREQLMMQNGVQGLCPTKYSEKTTLNQIVELKDLDSCIQRSKSHNWQLSPLTPFWNMVRISIELDKYICDFLRHFQFNSVELSSNIFQREMFVFSFLIYALLFLLFRS